MQVIMEPPSAFSSTIQPLPSRNTNPRKQKALDANLAKGVLSNPSEQQNYSYRIYLHKVTWICTLGGLLFGYDTGVINGAIEFMKRDLGLTNFTIGVVTSSLLVGAAFGALISGKLSDKFGRKKTLIILSIIFIIGTIGSSLTPTFATMIPFRVILGLAVGGASATVPVYLAELSPAKRRGQVVTRNELMIVAGQLLAYIINAILGNVFKEHDGIWRWMLLLAVIPAIGLLLGLLFAEIPESPRWLASQERYEEALEVLRKTRKTETSAVAELADVSITAKDDKQLKLKDVMGEPWLRRCLFIGIGIAMCNQLAGVNSIMYYGTSILTQQGLQVNGALIANIANGVISVLATGIGIYLLGRLGRRPMLLTGQLGTVATHLAIGTCTLVLPKGLVNAFVVLFLTVTFLLFQQGGISPVTWLMQSEMFPLRIRGLGMGLSTFVLWMVNCLISLTFPGLVEILGISTTFYIFAGVGCLAALFVFIWMPETRGKTLEELERQFHTEDMKALKKPGSATIGDVHAGVEKRDDAWM